MTPSQVQVQVQVYSRQYCKTLPWGAWLEANQLPDEGHATLSRKRYDKSNKKYKKKIKSTRKKFTSKIFKEKKTLAHTDTTGYNWMGFQFLYQAVYNLGYRRNKVKCKMQEQKQIQNIVSSAWCYKIVSLIVTMIPSYLYNRKE